MVPRTRVRSLSCALRAAFRAARKVEARLWSGDTGATSVLAYSGIHLPLTLFTRLFEVPMFPKVGKDAGFLTLFLEPLQRPFEALVIVDDDFWHSLIHPSRALLRAGIEMSCEI